jgi:hypothetical protein
MRCEALDVDHPRNSRRPARRDEKAYFSIGVSRRKTPEPHYVLS